MYHCGNDICHLFKFFIKISFEVQRKREFVEVRGEKFIIVARVESRNFEDGGIAKEV